ncbi:uncharacterized protein LOC106152451 [Lingula anatina]|uniref:Uncharacterized protein LOC106152451 n=1 Tax=Lingula anatina TaxID=7574 RepID=A0A1S3H8N1_LINAN|nr:uncharacterized protein LOC106152451 [Lingula anatina]XP_013381490.1 uncharacterized protein LOC106152451 [Lingula anatina]|eukprot:XP_013381489.1 uncharacterized protein LOC106152451 [Lingula anatina]
MDEPAHHAHRYGHQLLKIATHWSSESCQTTSAKNKWEEKKLTRNTKHLDAERKTCLRLIEGQKNALKKHLSDLHHRRTQIAHYTDDNSDMMLDSLRKMPKQLYANIFLSQRRSCEYLSEASYLEDDMTSAEDASSSWKDRRSLSDATLELNDTRASGDETDSQKVRPLTVPSLQNQGDDFELPDVRRDSNIVRSTSHEIISKENDEDSTHDVDDATTILHHSPTMRPRAYSESVKHRIRRRSFIFPDSPSSALFKRSPSHSSNESLGSAEDVKSVGARLGRRRFTVSPLVGDMTPQSSPSPGSSPPRGHIHPPVTLMSKTTGQCPQIQRTRSAAKHNPQALKTEDGDKYHLDQTSHNVSSSRFYVNTSAKVQPRRLLSRETEEKNVMQGQREKHHDKPCGDKEKRGQLSPDVNNTPRKNSLSADSEKENSTPLRRNSFSSFKHYKRHSTASVSSAKEKQTNSKSTDIQKLAVHFNRERRLSLPSVIRQTIAQKRFLEKQPSQKNSESGNNAVSYATPPALIIPTIVLHLVADDPPEEAGNYGDPHSIFMQGTPGVY